MDTESIIGIVIVLIIMSYILVMIISFWFSKRLSAIMFISAFFGGAVYISIRSLMEDLFVNIFAWCLVLVMGWAGLNIKSTDTARARIQLLDRLKKRITLFVKSAVANCLIIENLRNLVNLC
jgi:hypothetical protein